MTEQLTARQLSTENTIIELIGLEHTELLYQYNIDNREHLAPWEPARAEEYYSVESTERLIEQYLVEYDQGTSIRYLALSKDKQKVIAVCCFTNIVYGPFQACNLGYSISEAYQGKGIMRQILNVLVTQVFEQLNLHRIMANYMPSNRRSGHLLKRLGFEQEGLAKSYLKIAGRWQDHILMSKLNPNHETD